MKKLPSIALGAAVLSGVVLRPAANLPRQQRGVQTGQSSSQGEAADGPWRASCSYWKPGLAAEPEPAKSAKEAGLKMHRAEHDAGSSAVLAIAISPSTSSCSATQWGIPERGSGPSRITALLATVPDPIHSSLALEFDRAIDDFTQAASEYGYVASYYWLPWKTPDQEAQKLATGKAGTHLEEAAASSAEPGLVIFKQSCSEPSQTAAKCEAETPLIYLFLVGQGPALGVDGEQLKRALKYEGMLAGAYGARLSFKRCSPARGPRAGTPPAPIAAVPCSEADAIGPNNSGGAASLEAGLNASSLPVDTIAVAGITSTDAAAGSFKADGKRKITYLSFFDHSKFEQSELQELFLNSMYGQRGRLVILEESGTVLGAADVSAMISARTPRQPQPIIIRFPREISLLRNAESQMDASPESTPDFAASPYLHLSLKEPGVEDTLPHYAPGLTPFSQEAAWTSISRELKRRHASVVAIFASNVLDELFLAKSVHRDLPDARVVLHNSDLLFARYADNAPYLGDVAFTAYPLAGLSHPGTQDSHLDTFASSSNQALFNAAVYTLWDGQSLDTLHLAGYGNPFDASKTLRPPLWANTIGRDGFYPIGIVDPCPSATAAILPEIPQELGLGVGTVECTSTPSRSAPWIPKPAGADFEIYPATSWYYVCLVITLVCLVRAVTVLNASFWSPFSRDLAIEWSDEPRRRAVYMNIAAAALFCMSWVTTFPVAAAFYLLHAGRLTVSAATVTCFSGILVVAATLYRTRRYLGAPKGDRGEMAETSFYPWFNCLALLTAIAVPGLWSLICMTNLTQGTQSYVGLYFSYRCLYLASGVCPLLPAILVLSAWYLWARLQTSRLRFSPNNRPLLPGRIELESVTPLYVSDDDLKGCSNPLANCLYRDITSLLITRELIWRQLRRIPPMRAKVLEWAERRGAGFNKILDRVWPSNTSSYFNVAFSVIYLGLFYFFVVHLRIQGLDRFMRPQGWLPTPYEFLMSALFYPLLTIALAGCIRMIAIWSSLSHGLLQRLERSPLRFAFSRLSNVPWVTMLRQAGLLEYWQDMSRTTESLQQLWHTVDDPATILEASRIRSQLKGHVALLTSIASGKADEVTVPVLRKDGTRYLAGSDLPAAEHMEQLSLMCAIESDYAEFAEVLLSGTLAPYWLNERQSPVDGELVPAPQETGPVALPCSPELPLPVLLAEEFLAIRYVAVIRAILINLRLLMTFISAAFIFSILAWNSYPFQPRQWVDWAFTLLLFGILTSFILVFAQMHRNPVLSRITGTKANELGGDFYFRLLTFCAAPLLVWLSSQFPGIGNEIYRLFESGLQITK